MLDAYAFQIWYIFGKVYDVSINLKTPSKCLFDNSSVWKEYNNIKVAHDLFKSVLVFSKIRIESGNFLIISAELIAGVNK